MTDTIPKIGDIIIMEPHAPQRSRRGIVIEVSENQVKFFRRLKISWYDGIGPNVSDHKAGEANDFLKRGNWTTILKEDFEVIDFQVGDLIVCQYADSNRVGFVKRLRKNDDDNVLVQFSTTDMTYHSDHYLSIITRDGSYKHIREKKI